MKKIIIFLTMIYLYSYSFGEIKIKIFEPIRFKDVITKSITGDKIVGVGILEISTEDLENDGGKKLVFNFPEMGAMTNKKKWIKIEEYRLESKNKEFVITKKIEQIKIFAILDKRDLDNGEDATIIEGEYIGYVPLIVSQYGKLNQKGE